MAINNVIGDPSQRQSGASLIFNSIKNAMDQAKAQKLAMAQAMINSGTYQPATPGITPPQSLFQRIGQGISGPTLGGSNMNVGGQNFQYQTPQLQAQQQAQKLQAQVEALKSSGLIGSPMTKDVGSGNAMQTSSPFQTDISMKDGNLNLGLKQTDPNKALEAQKDQLEIAKLQKDQQDSQNSENLGKLPPDQAQAQMMKTSPSYAKYLQSLAEGRQQLGGRSSAAMQKIQKDLAAMYPDLDQSKIQARWKTRQDFTTGKSAQNIKSLNTAVQHLAELNKIIPKLDNIQVPGVGHILNVMKNSYMAQSGNPVISRFKAIKNALSGELANIYKVSGGTDTEIKHVGDTIDMADSPEGLKASVDEAITLMGGRLSALQDQWHNAYDRPNDTDFPVISPKSKATLNAMGAIDDGGADQGQAQQGKYTVGQVIPMGDKKYKVTGGDPNDPDIEEVK